jgi:hypothetical protein
MKRPAFQFYPKDWRDETSLRLCSMAARGLWIELMCLMHASDNYGYLEVAGQPISDAQIARLVGEPVKSVSAWIAELSQHNVCSYDERGIMFSRRMVRDEALREERAAGGIKGAPFGHKGGTFGMKGGRPKLVE